MPEPRLVSNKWEIIRVIGHGGMGSVYEVRHTTLEIRRALKTLHRHLADDPDVVRRFLREGRNEARLEHPNIVRVYDFDTDPDFGAYLTMELVEGQDLKQLMQQGSVPFHEVVRIGCEVAAALDYAHSAVPPVVHRDIKPANILISARTGTAKVTDFGIAKELAERETGVTGTQGFIGTIRYAAPEQVRDDVKIDARCDLYSLGVMLYELYSGKIFLEGEKPADIYRRTMVEPDWQPPMVYPTPPPEEFAEVVRWCLQRKREDRVPSARELGKCLRVCVVTAEEHGQYHPAPSSGEPPAIIPDLAALPEPFAETSVTAATVVALLVEEESTTIVGLRAKIIRFRQDLNAEADTFRDLHGEAVAMGLSIDGVATPDDFSRQLVDLDEEVDAAGDSRDRERLAHAFSRGERLREEYGAGTAELQRRLADGVAAAIADLRTAWQGIVDTGGAAVSSEARAAFGALLETAQTRAEAADWPSVRAALQQARTAVEETRTALTQQAETTVEELLREGAAVVAELTRYLAAGAAPDVDMAAVQRAVAADLANGRPEAAIGRARDAVEQARHALERGRGETLDLLERHRRAADDVLHSLDPESAERIAPDEFRRGSAALESARDAEKREHVAAAAEHYREAAELLEQVRTRATEQQTARLDTLKARVTELLQEAGRHAEAVTGPARTRADVLMREEVKGGGTTAIEALETARQLLEDALAEVPDYLAAQEATEAARAAEERVRKLEPSPAQLEVVTRQHAEASAALAERRWREAAATYREAEHAWVRLERDLEGEHAAAQAAERAATACAAAIERLDVDGAEAVAVGELAAARELAANARTLQQQHEWTAAASAYDSATQAFAGLHERVQQELAPQLTVAIDALRRSLAATGEAPVAITGPARQRAEAALAATATTKVSAAIASIGAARASLDQALAEVAEHQQAMEQRTAAETMRARVAQLGLGRRDLQPIDRLAKDAGTAFDRREWTWAREAYAQLQTQLASLEQQAAHSQRLAAARTVATEARAAVDVPTAQECAADVLHEAEQAFAAAEHAGDTEPAAADYERAQALYARTGELVAAEYARRIDVEVAQLRDVVNRTADAPAEAVGSARQQAEAALAAPTTDAREAVARLQTARTALTEAQETVPAFLAAREQQERATEAQARVETLHSRRAPLKAARALVKDAAAAAQRRDWVAMRDGYAKAADAFTALEQVAREQPTPPSRRIRLVPVAGVVALVAAAIVWQLLPRTKPAPPPQSTKPVEQQSKEKAAPQPPPIASWSIASAKPADDVVAGRESAPLAFNIVPAGGPAGSTAKIEWLLDDAPVQTDGAAWTYTPGFDAAGSHTVVARIDGGAGSNQTRTWKVRVEDVNRPPVLAKILPDPKTAIDAKVGDSVVLKAEATDADRDDRLTYRWTVDGKPAGSDAPQLNLKVAANHTVGLNVSDGKDAAQTSWQVTALSPLVFDYSPKQLDVVRFGSLQEFKLAAPRDLPLGDVTVTWTLDGRKVSDGPTFSLQTTDSMVRGTPVKITATAVDKQGRSFSHEWKASVVPPVPKIESMTPPTDKPIEAEAGQVLAFHVAAAPAVGNQQLTVASTVDGKPGPRGDQFAFEVKDENEHRITARVEDNYRQASPAVTWRVQGSDILSQARKWVAAFQDARRSGDAEKEGRLRDLAPTEVNRLKDAYSKQKNLQVSFTAPQVDKLAANRALVKFGMTQAFETPDGQPISGRVACEFTLTRTDSGLHEQHGAQGPCVPVP